MSLDLTCQLFKLLRKEAAVEFPKVKEITLYTDWSAADGGARQFAYCEQNDKGVRIVVAPDFEEQGSDHVEAILAHEIGHAIDFLYTRKQIESVLGSALPKTPERLADEIVYRLWGTRISYNGKLCLQSFRSGITPRPRKLGL